MKKRIRMIVTGMALVMTLSACAPQGEQQTKEEQTMVNETSNQSSERARYVGEDLTVEWSPTMYDLMENRVILERNRALDQRYFELFYQDVFLVNREKFADKQVVIYLSNVDSVGSEIGGSLLFIVNSTDFSIQDVSFTLRALKFGTSEEVVTPSDLSISSEIVKIPPHTAYQFQTDIYLGEKIQSGDSFINLELDIYIKDLTFDIVEEGTT